MGLLRSGQCEARARTAAEAKEGTRSPLAPLVFVFVSFPLACCRLVAKEAREAEREREREAVSGRNQWTLECAQVAGSKRRPPRSPAWPNF